MTGIIYEHSFLVIQYFLFIVKGSTNNINYKDGTKTDIFNTKGCGIKIGYFDIYNSNFYFMGYSSINSFKSGYYNIYSFKKTLNDKSPLEEIFDESMIIKNMSFIKHTKYIYYKIYVGNENIFIME